MNKSEEIKNQVIELQKEKSALRSMMMTEIALLAAMLVLLFTVNLKTVYLAGIPALVYSLLLMRPAKKRYLSRLNRAECLLGIGAGLEECQYSFKGSLPKDALEKACLVSPREWPVEAVCRHSIKGSFAGADVHICECSFALKHGVRSGDVSFLSGSWISAQLLQNSGLNLCCMSRNVEHVSDGIFDLNCYGLRRVPFASGKAKEGALAFTDGDRIPEWLEKQFMKLFGSGTGALLSLQGDELSIMIVHRFYAPKHKVSDPFTEDSLSFNRLPELTAALDIIRIIQRNAAL